MKREKERERETFTFRKFHNCNTIMHCFVHLFQIERCVTLLRANQGASRRFYQLAVTHLSVSDVIKFILSIHVAVVQCVKSEGGEGKGVSQGRCEGGGAKGEQEEEDIESVESDKSNH